MLKIDIDGFPNRLYLQRVFYSLPRPFFVRLSSSRKGLHLAVPLCAEWDSRRFMWDDTMRIDLDQQRARAGLPVHNLLWDVKNGKHAGEWQIIRDERGIERFLDRVQPIHLLCQIAHKYV
jgi:hypothetical protein